MPRVLLGLLLVVGSLLVPPAGAPSAAAAETDTVLAFGDASFHGSTGTTPLARAITDVDATRDGGGYWLAGRDGGVFAFGNARFLGSTGALTLNQPVVGMAATPSGDGYWLVAADGGVFAFGAARFLGSMGAVTLEQAVVGMAATPSGAGYWLVAADGGVFAFGDARFAGSTGAITLNRPVVGMAATPSGAGYWLVAADGGVFAFGDARFAGSAAGRPTDDLVVGMASTPSGAGYWLATTGPGLFPAFWPRATPSAARDLQRSVDEGREPWRLDPAAVARAFARDVVGWSIVVDRVVTSGSASAGWTGEVTFRPLIGEGGGFPGRQHRLGLMGLRGVDRPVWFVTGLVAERISVTTPSARAFVASPLRVAGRGAAFEATLLTRIADDNGRTLHPRPGQPEGFVMGGTDTPQPFAGRLLFSRPTAPSGTLTISGDAGTGPSPDVSIVRVHF